MGRAALEAGGALEALRDPKLGLMSNSLVETFGWGVTKRYEFAKQIGERSVDGAQARQLWAAAIQSIKSSPKYGGLDLTPQMGLVPIGVDPNSGLWEFAQLMTGEPPSRGLDGKLLLTDETGVVYVLIPSGTFWMGAQATDKHGRNYDPWARLDESPVHEVELSAYFLSKYEMTQGQWDRLVGRNPSWYGKETYNSSWNKVGKAWTSLHPVEEVSWTECMEAMRRAGCELPTEAQWENGCRAGTSSVYWSGDGLDNLGEVANVSDSFSKSHGGELLTSWEKDIDDGNTAHAEVGSYLANAYGLHDVHGNVWEWCRDGYGTYAFAREVDPLTPWTGTPYRIDRGGSFFNGAASARSADRNRSTPDDRDLLLGLRPARAITP